MFYLKDMDDVTWTPPREKLLVNDSPLFVGDRIL